MFFGKVDIKTPTVQGQCLFQGHWATNPGVCTGLLNQLIQSRLQTLLNRVELNAVDNVT